MDLCPVTVVTGFLGAGKTSIINHLIRSDPGERRFAVIVNEFGALGIDGGLIAQSEDDVIELSNGCLCCEVRGDLIAACERLLARRGQFDWLIIETSGLADPVPVAQSFLVGDGPGEHYRLDGIVTLVDAVHAAGLSERDPVAASQLAMADRIVITKTDLVLPAVLRALPDQLRKQNAGAEILLSSPEQPAFRALTGLNACAPDTITKAVATFVPPRHDLGITSLSFRFDRPFDFTAFSGFIRRLMVEKGRDLLRVKGVLWLEGEERRFVFHGVQTLVDGDVTTVWGEDPRESRLVLIGRSLDHELIRGRLADCLV